MSIQYCASFQVAPIVIVDIFLSLFLASELDFAALANHI